MFDDSWWLVVNTFFVLNRGISPRGDAARRDDTFAVKLLVEMTRLRFSNSQFRR
jgi:hypothetical protein